MPQSVDIGRLTLRFAGRAPHDAERLARMIADRIATATALSELRRPVDSVRVKHTASPRATDDMLANELAEAILRELERTI
jgi:hypothetical protein